MNSQSKSQNAGSDSQTAKREQTNAGPFLGASGHDRESSMNPRSQIFSKELPEMIPKGIQKAPKPANIFLKCLQPFNKNNGEEKQRKKEIKRYKKQQKEELKREKKYGPAVDPQAWEDYVDIMAMSRSSGAGQPVVRMANGRVVSIDASWGLYVGADNVTQRPVYGQNR